MPKRRAPMGLLDGLVPDDPFAAGRFQAGGNAPPPELGPMFEEMASRAHLDPNWQRRQIRSGAEYLGANPEWQERFALGADMMTPTTLAEDVVRDVGAGDYRDAALTAGIGSAGWLAGPLAGLVRRGGRPALEGMGLLRGLDEAAPAKALPKKPPPGRMQELDDFLADPGPDKRRWVRGNGLEAYVRRPSNSVLEIDSITAEKPGQGALTRMLDAYEPETSIFVENIMNERLAEFLKRRGYEISGDFGNMSRTVSASKRRER